MTFVIYFYAAAAAAVIFVHCFLLGSFGPPEINNLIQKFENHS